MQYAGHKLLRMPLLRGWMNRGKRKGRSAVAQPSWCGCESATAVWGLGGGDDYRRQPIKNRPSVPLPLLCRGAMVLVTAWTSPPAAATLETQPPYVKGFPSSLTANAGIAMASIIVAITKAIVTHNSTRLISTTLSLVGRRKKKSYSLSPLCTSLVSRQGGWLSIGHVAILRKLFNELLETPSPETPRIFLPRTRVNKGKGD